MVFVYVRGDKPLALASGLSPVHTHNQTITFLCEMFDVKQWNINERRIKVIYTTFTINNS